MKNHSFLSLLYGIVLALAVATPVAAVAVEGPRPAVRPAEPATT
jgi:hypothetical protein